MELDMEYADNLVFVLQENCIVQFITKVQLNSRLHITLIN